MSATPAGASTATLSVNATSMTRVVRTFTGAELVVTSRLRADGTPRMKTPLLTEEELPAVQAVHLAAYRKDGTRWRSNGPRTAAEALLWERGQMDARCPNVCGEGMAATAWCFRCYSPVLEYVSHADQAGSAGSLLCGAPNRQGRRPGLRGAAANAQSHDTAPSDGKAEA